jgi:hypothetical protein
MNQRQDITLKPTGIKMIKKEKLWRTLGNKSDDIGVIEKFSKGLKPPN